MNKLYIKFGERLIYIDENIYRIPKNISLIEKFGRDKNVAERTRELAREYGTEFHSFFDGLRCIDCSYIDWASMAARGGVTIIRGPASNLCKYKGNTDKIGVFSKRSFLFLRKRIMATNEPCTISDAFHRALMEQGHLDQFLLENVTPQEFYSIKEIEQNPMLEEQAVEQYRMLRKAA